MNTNQQSEIAEQSSPRQAARVKRDFSCRRLLTELKDDKGAITAEYAVVIMAAVAFAGLLVAILRSGEVRAMLVDLVQQALGTAG